MRTTCMKTILPTTVTFVPFKLVLEIEVSNVSELHKLRDQILSAAQISESLYKEAIKVVDSEISYYHDLVRGGLEI